MLRSCTGLLSVLSPRTKRRRVAFGHLLGEDAGETDDGGGGFGQAVGVGGIGLRGLMDERAIGGAGGDVGERVRGVRGIDEVALGA